MASSAITSVFESFLRDEAGELAPAGAQAALVDALVPLVYDELRGMAHYLLAAESPSLTVQTTVLVHEAYLKLARDQRLPERGRSYFFAAAARAMRQVLVEAARRRGRLRRGGGERAIELDAVEVAADDRLLEVDAALRRFAEVYPRQARVLECRYFAGLSVEETAEALSLSPRTVKRDWSLAQAWLYRELSARS